MRSPCKAIPTSLVCGSRVRDPYIDRSRPVAPKNDGVGMVGDAGVAGYGRGMGVCAVEIRGCKFALISTICPSFSLNMTGYSPQMRGKWWSDIEFSLSRLSTAQTPWPRPYVASIMDSIRMEPTRVLRRGSASSPTATIPANISRRLPATVTSCTGYASSPFSTQKPATPRE